MFSADSAGGDAVVQVLEAGGAHMKQLKFDPVSFEDEAEYEIEVLNNGPAPVQWRGHVLTKSDHRVKLQYEEDQGDQEVRLPPPRIAHQ